MNIGICNLSVIPLRATHTHRSEMVNQVLFAEKFEILLEEKDWVHVRLFDTNYEGWLQRGQFISLSENQWKNISEDHHFVVDITGGTAFSYDRKVDLIPGTKIPNSLLQQQYSDFPYRIEGNLRQPNVADFESEFPQLIDYYHNSPYLWGGRTQVGIDCSGLSQTIYNHFGLQLPRDAYQQAEQGKVVDFLSEIKPGDLAFFDNEEGRITHVGVMMDTETIFHASANVRIDKMDLEGIYNKDQNRYTHKLRIVKRFW